MRISQIRLSRWQWYGVDALVVILIGLVTYLSVAVWQSGLSDVTLYYQDAVAFWQDKPILSQLPQEYPPLALLPFSLTLLPIHDFITAFGVGMAALNVALYASFVRWSTRSRALACMAYLFVGEQALMVMRYDVLPALLTVGALWAAQRRHYPWAYLLLGLGTLAKLYPILFVPVVMIAQWRGWDGEHENHENLRKTRQGLEILGMALIAPLVIVAGFGVALWRNPQGALSPLTYATHRPVQVEALLGTVAWLGSLRGIPVTEIYTYGSVNWVGPLADRLAGWSTLLMVVGCALVYLWQWRGGMTLARAFLGVICMALLWNRVFSTQYLIWAAPLVAEAEGWDVGWLLVFALNGLDLALYPYSTPGYSDADVLRFLLVVTARNLALLAVTIWLLWRTRAPDLAVSSRSLSTGTAGGFNRPPFPLPLQHAGMAPTASATGEEIFERSGIYDAQMVVLHQFGDEGVAQRRVDQALLIAARGDFRCRGWGKRRLG